LGFGQLTKPKRSTDKRLGEIDEAIATLEKEEAQAPAPERTLPALPQETREAQKGTGCVPCTADHLSTCAGALSEALRFARARGVQDAEVQGRLALCVDELNIWERVDAAADKLAPLSAPEREFLRRWLPPL